MPEYILGFTGARTMLHFWFEVFARAFVDTLGAIGKDPADLRFSLLVLAIITIGVFIKDGMENGWRDMKERIRALLGKDVTYIIVICCFVFAYNLLREPFSMWQSENQKYESKDKELLASDQGVRGCSGDLKVQQNKADLEQIQLTSQQETINSQQGTVNSLQNTLNKQQAAVTTCVGDLAKAILPEPSKANMLLLPTAEDHDAKHTAYILLLTNKPITPIHLSLWCDA